MAINSARGPEWEKLRLAVLDRDGWQCVACGALLEGGNATVDHIHAIDAGGEKLPPMEELVSLCRPCNSRKGTRPQLRITYVSQRWLPAGIAA